MKCFFHKSDLDGHCAGAIVKLKFPECEMIGVDYQDSLFSLKQSFYPGEPVFVVDFSFEPAEMKILNDETDLIWIDHHKSAIEKVKNAGISEVKGRQIEGYSGCELTWDYLNQEKVMPLAVLLLGRYDVWDHSDERTLPFQYGCRFTKDTYPDNIQFWESLLFSDGFCKSVLETGIIILEYETSQNEKIAGGMAFEKEFYGYRAICINKPFSNSKIFDSVYNPDNHDIMIVFGVKDGVWKYTLYCDKPEIDVSKIAENFEFKGRKGGGHRGASGFYSDKYIF